jgi:hypothetical protein
LSDARGRSFLSSVSAASSVRKTQGWDGQTGTASPLVRGRIRATSTCTAAQLAMARGVSTGQAGGPARLRGRDCKIATKLDGTGFVNFIRN